MEIIKAGSTGKCPFCGVVNRFEGPVTESTYTGKALIEELIINQGEKPNSLYLAKCAACKEVILTYNQKMIFPLGSNRSRCPEEVPENLKNDYKETCLVEPLSKKAAAALGRRCLQNLLREQGFKAKDLSDEIDLAIKKLPSHLSENIDAIRNIGNYAAHPIKSQKTGEIVEVEPQEAEWVLDVLEGLFESLLCSTQLI